MHRSERVKGPANTNIKDYIAMIISSCLNTGFYDRASNGSIIQAYQLNRVSFYTMVINQKALREKKNYAVSGWLFKEPLQF